MRVVLARSVWAAVVLAGCAGRVPVAIDIEALPPGPDPGQIVPRFVELRHEEQGWIHVDLQRGGRIADRMQPGVAVELATADLPRGRYEAVRLGYLAAEPRAPEAGEGAAGYRPGTEPAVRWIPGETMALRTFCIGSGASRSISLGLATGDAAGVEPRLVVHAPACADEGG